MKIIIAAVGRGKKSAEAELVARYLKQTKWDIAIKELPDAPSNLPPAERQSWEAKKLEPLLKDARIIALDASGEQLASPQFTKLITGARENGAKQLVFVIGGQDGLHESLVKRAQKVIAFGKATWPHQLVRAMLAEQLYRAYSISIGHPYHSGH